MLVLLLSEYISLGDIQNCYDASLINIQSKTNEITAQLEITKNPECLEFTGSVEFILEMKTSTATLDQVLTRYKVFNYSENHIVTFSSQQDLTEVVQASIQLKNMLNYTTIIIGQIILDSSLPTECFQTNVLNITNNETILELDMKSGCKYMFASTLNKVQILNFGLEKLPQANNSVFLDGFSDFDKTLKIQFPSKISYQQIKNGFQSNNKVLFELEVDGIINIVESLIQDLIAHDHDDYATDLQIVITSDLLLTEFVPNQVVMSQLELISLDSIEVQLGLLKNNTWQYLFVSFDNIDQIDMNFSFVCDQDCLDTIEDIQHVQLNFIGVYQDQIQFISSQSITEFFKSSFLSGQVDFPDDMIRITIQQAPWNPFGSLYRRDIARLTILVFTLEDKVYTFNTGFQQITPETSYLSVKCLTQECLTIKKLYRDNEIKYIIIDFTRLGAGSPFDVIQIEYTNNSQITGSFWITLLVSILLAIILSLFQLFSVKIFSRKPRKQRAKKISCDDIV